MLPPEDAITHPGHSRSKAPVQLTLRGPVEDQIRLVLPHQSCETTRRGCEAADVPEAAGGQGHGLDAEARHLVHKRPVVEEDHCWLDPPTVDALQKRPQDVL